MKRGRENFLLSESPVFLACYNLSQSNILQRYGIRQPGKNFKGKKPEVTGADLVYKNISGNEGNGGAGQAASARFGERSIPRGAGSAGVRC